MFGVNFIKLPCVGKFNICDIKINGILIFTKLHGKIVLKIEQKISEKRDFLYVEKINIITGILDSGVPVQLFNCRRMKYHEYHDEGICMYCTSFEVEYAVLKENNWDKNEYNVLECVLENALDWSKIEIVEWLDRSCIRFKPFEQEVSINLFGETVEFYADQINKLYSIPLDEESEVISRLVIKIKAKKKRSIDYFIETRNKIISLISFAKKDNINIGEQFLYSFDDTYELCGDKVYWKKILYTSDPQKIIIGTPDRKFNFFLTNLSKTYDINEKLTLLEPVFNLYLSQFRYSEMPLEMVFLNIIQAVETFHARFFYEDKKGNYIDSVEKRFSQNENYEDIKKLLLNKTQVDCNCHHIILVSRINDLLIRGGEIFNDYYDGNSQFAQELADTRHYYTHYAKEKKGKAIKGERLKEAIEILSLVLDYHICLQLNINNHYLEEREMLHIAGIDA